MQCIQCKKEFNSKRADAKFCSDKCRKSFSRKADKVSEIKRTSEINVRDNLSDLTAQDLYDAINSYEADTWASSPEYAELKRRLKKNSVEQLKKENFWIPAWKLHAQIL